MIVLCDHAHGDHGNSPLPVFPTPQSSLHLDFDGSACKRLITHKFSRDGVVALIGEIFTSQDEVKMIGFLRADQAQTFIDVIDEVRVYVHSFPRSGLMEFSPFSFYEFISVILCQPGSGLR